MATQQSIPYSFASSKFPSLIILHTQSPRQITQCGLVL